MSLYDSVAVDLEIDANTEKKVASTVPQLHDVVVNSVPTTTQQTSTTSQHQSLPSTGQASTKFAPRALGVPRSVRAPTKPTAVAKRPFIAAPQTKTIADVIQADRSETMIDEADPARDEARRRDEREREELMQLQAQIREEYNPAHPCSYEAVLLRREREREERGVRRGLIPCVEIDVTHSRLGKRKYHSDSESSSSDHERSRTKSATITTSVSPETPASWTSATSSQRSRMILFVNMVDEESLLDSTSAVTEFEEDLRAECESFGAIDMVQVYTPSKFVLPIDPSIIGTRAFVRFIQEEHAIQGLCRLNPLGQPLSHF